VCCLCRPIKQVRTLFVSGLPMDAKPRELHLLFQAYKVRYSISYYRVMLCVARTVPSQDVRPSIRPSVCLSVCNTPVFCLNSWTYRQTFSPSESHTVLFFRTKWYGNIPTGILLHNGAPNAVVWKIVIFEHTRYGHSYCGRRLGNRNQAFKLYKFQWPWTTHDQDFKVTPLLNAEYLRNGSRYIYSYNQVLIGSYALLKGVIFKWPWVTLGEIFNDPKHRVLSLRQLSFLFYVDIISKLLMHNDTFCVLIIM